MTKTQSFWIGRLDKYIDFLISVQFNINSLGFFQATIADYEISNAVYVERGENSHRDRCWKLIFVQTTDTFMFALDIFEETILPCLW